MTLQQLEAAVSTVVGKALASGITLAEVQRVLQVHLLELDKSAKPHEARSSHQGEKSRVGMHKSSCDFLDRTAHYQEDCRASVLPKSLGCLCRSLVPRTPECDRSRRPGRWGHRPR